MCEWINVLAFRKPLSKENNKQILTMCVVHTKITPNPAWAKKKVCVSEVQKNSLRSPLILQDLLTICVVRIKKTPKQKQKKKLRIASIQARSEDTNSP